MKPYHLKNSHLHLRVLPEFGGGIAFFRYFDGRGELELMRPAPEPCPSASDTNFVLAPYSNRIADGVFQFEGEQYQLAHPEKHAIHGDLRRQTMEVVEHSDVELQLGFRSDGVSDFNYPFPLSFELRYALDQRMLECCLAIENIGERRAPVGGGFHPYFCRSLNGSEDVMLSFSAERMYEYPPGTTPLPKGAASTISSDFDFSQLRPLKEGIDHCYADWDGHARMRWPESRVQLELRASAEMRHLVLYTPAGDRHFAVEPVSNATDAFNLAANGVQRVGMIVLEPGQRCEMTMTLEVSEEQKP